MRKRTVEVMVTKPARRRRSVEVRLSLPVALPALLARINRKLAADGRQIRKSRSARARQDLGDWYVVDLQGNAIVWSGVDPEALARELGALKAYEKFEGGHAR